MRFVASAARLSEATARFVALVARRRSASSCFSAAWGTQEQRGDTGTFCCCSDRCCSASHRFSATSFARTNSATLASSVCRFVCSCSDRQGGGGEREPTSKRCFSLPCLSFRSFFSSSRIACEGESGVREEEEEGRYHN